MEYSIKNTEYSVKRYAHKNEPFTKRSVTKSNSNVTNQKVTKKRVAGDKKEYKLEQYRTHKKSIFYETYPKKP